ncbi:head-tail connector protein [Oceanobacillus profundus]|uniref:head-tail connector protein n=1 Tax=Oceanobacillus TaxID=182709 RepID=UPI0026E27E42|nr:head-tail connector protein [Oceanobacillus profundus]MDO6448090.1 head-tail connector protein [Oceanobacillus profundus]
MLSLVKQFLRLDDHYKYEDELLNHLIETAKEYLKNATGQEFNEEINIHKQIVILLVTSWYENRNTQISQELDRTLTSMLLQAGLIGDV